MLLAPALSVLAAAAAPIGSLRWMSFYNFWDNPAYLSTQSHHLKSSLDPRGMRSYAGGIPPRSLCIGILYCCDC
jgi:hypothetical protein